MRDALAFLLMIGGGLLVLGAGPGIDGQTSLGLILTAAGVVVHGSAPVRR